MSTPNVDEAALLRANLLGFMTQVKYATGATDAELPALYKKATDYQNQVMTKRAKVRDLILAQIAPAAA
jgi:hypothetical protein